MSVRRTPSTEISRRLCATGISSHFSGHMHIYDRASVETEGRRLTNYAMPSLVAFPAVFAIAEAAGRTLALQLEPVNIDTHRALFPAYRAEMARLGEVADWLEAESYSDYLFGQIGEQVIRRQLRNEFPEPLKSFQSRASLADALVALGINDVADTLRNRLAGLSLQRFLIDMHAMRMGSEIALQAVAEDRLETYRLLAYVARSRPVPDDPLGVQLQRVLAMFDCFSADNHALAWTQRGG